MSQKPYNASVSVAFVYLVLDNVFIAWSNFGNPGEYILNTKSNGLYWYWSTTLAINLFTFCGHPNCLCMLEGIIEFYYATFWNIALFAKHNWLYICICTLKHSNDLTTVMVFSDISLQQYLGKTKMHDIQLCFIIMVRLTWTNKIYMISIHNQKIIINRDQQQFYELFYLVLS